MKKTIFLHGLGQTSYCWSKTIENIGIEERAVCPNLSTLVQGRETNYENLYSAFSDICNEHSEKVNLCGLSLGGVLSLNYAIDHPDKVNSLILIAAQYKMPKKLLSIQNTLFRFMPKSMFQEMGFRKEDFLVLCKTMMELDFSNSLNAVNSPVLIICGEKDSANKKASMELADRLTNAELCIVEGANHEINIEMPEKLAELIKRFYLKS
ncbi:MAG: alpha/beta hydrolase [Tyzzerella sp.]|nr:alpha/beta hydrolase [Tyzzerella sp.]